MGNSTQLSWSVQNATSVILTGFGNVGNLGNVTVSPASTTTYQITASNGNSVDSRSVTIGVISCDNTVISNIPDVSIDKLVRNITTNTSELDSVSARPGNIIEFILRVRSTGNFEAKDVRITDSLPAVITYLSGTTTVNGRQISDQGNLFNGGISLGTLIPSATSEIRFRAIIGDTAPGSQLSATNTGTVFASNVGSRQDGASVVITMGIVAGALTVKTGSSVNWLNIALGVVGISIGLTMVAIRKRSALL